MNGPALPLPPDVPEFTDNMAGEVENSRFGSDSLFGQFFQELFLMIR
jgi:hypothetical protein